MSAIHPLPEPYRGIKVQIVHHPNARFNQWWWEVTDGFFHGPCGWTHNQRRAEFKAEKAVAKIMNQRERAKSVVVESYVVPGTEGDR